MSFPIRSENAVDKFITRWQSASGSERANYQLFVHELCTLLERALDPTERHALGAHYTPRAYVERLVLPTIVEPLREDWKNAQAAALVLAGEGKLSEAQQQVRDFLKHLCEVRVLDPACGSGNFLYVTLEHLKRLEGEVLNQLDELGDTRGRLDLQGVSVDPHQLLGIELNPHQREPSELLTFGRLAREQEGLRVFSFAADFERAEVLVPEPVGGIGIGFSPRFELVKVFRGDLAFAQPVKQMVAERGRQSGPLDPGHYSPKVMRASSALRRF